ncbi:MAG: hypothetical protein ACUZ8E_17605 [Candidatus Anammoxibacter sp.]
MSYEIIKAPKDTFDKMVEKYNSKPTSNLTYALSKMEIGDMIITAIHHQKSISIRSGRLKIVVSTEKLGCSELRVVRIK